MESTKTIIITIIMKPNAHSSPIIIDFRFAGTGSGTSGY